MKKKKYLHTTKQIHSVWYWSSDTFQMSSVESFLVCIPNQSNIKAKKGPQTIMILKEFPIFFFFANSSTISLNPFQNQKKNYKTYYRSARLQVLTSFEQFYLCWTIFFIYLSLSWSILGWKHRTTMKEPTVAVVCWVNR